MTVRDTTPRTQTETIAFEYDLQHPPEKVWRAITDPALLSEWLLPVTQLTPEPGSEFTFTTEPHPGWDGTVNCRILEADAPRMLRYSWVVADWLDTIVTFTLTPTPEGTRLTLVQSGFTPDQKKNAGGARYGWKMMGGRLIDLLAGTA